MNIKCPECESEDVGHVRMDDGWKNFCYNCGYIFSIFTEETG
jgi:uncharacterized Zn finger protein